MYDKLVEISKSAKPNEACAYLFKNNTIVIQANPDSNSSVHFEGIDSQWVYDLIQEHGTPSSLFHSHPCVAIPSYTDLMYMKTTIPFWDCVWFIMSNRYLLRAWTISGNHDQFPQRGETIRPVELEVNII